jgi:signal transduction histidine kinase/CheY-like chemotaxis protein
MGGMHSQAKLRLARSLPAVHDDDLRLPALQGFLVLLAALAFADWVMLIDRPDSLLLLLGGATLSVVVLLAYVLSAAYPRAASACVVALTTLLVLAAAAMGAPPTVLCALALPTLMAGSLLGPAAATAWGAACSAAAVALMGPAPDWSAAMLPLATGVFTWLALRPLHALLGWSWQRSMEATTLAEQLRDQRGKLNRTIKDLDASYQLLQQTNHELAVARQEADMLRDMRHRFATNLSHELRTPLNIIIGFSRLIYRKPQLYGYAHWSEALLRDLGEVQSNAAYLSNLVDDVVDLARVDAMAMPIRRESTDLGRLVRDTVETVRSLAAEKGLALGVDLPGALPLLYLDPQRIRQVVYNLLTNAIRFTERGGITVAATPGDAEVVVAVRDSGRGIPPHELEHIFSEFYQVSRPREEPGAGKGLGLAIAKRLVQLHGGRIWGESTVGEGATFFFSLPLTARTTSRCGPAAVVSLPDGRRKPRVLVVDGDGAMTGYLSRRLDGYEFVQAPGPAALPGLAERERPLAIVADAGGGPDGEPEDWPPLPAALPLLRATLPSSRWLLEQADFRAVLTKPVAEDGLLGAIDAVLTAATQRRHTLLLVDDDRGFLQLTTRLIEAYAPDRFQLAAAYSGQAALEKARRLRPSLILLDLALPDMSGFEVVRALRQEAETRDIPVVAVTAATPGEDELQASGVTFSLTRRGAFRAGELVALLDTALREAAGH